MTRTHRSGGRVSRAEIARRVAAAQAEAAVVRTLPPKIAALIDGYSSPAIPDPALTEIRPFLRDVVTASHLVGEESIRKHVTHLAHLSHYGLGMGWVLQIEKVMTTQRIDEYVVRGMLEASQSLRAERRRRLLSLAADVNPGPNTPAKMTPIGRRVIKPCYTPAEAAVIRRVSLNQPTAARRRNLCAVVGFGAGGGADSPHLRGLRVERVDDQGSKGIWVDFDLPTPRVVVIRNSYEELVRVAIDGLRATDLILGQKPDRHNLGARAVDNAALYRVPHIEPARLRATWLADLMTDAVPLGVILQAAGLKSARSLADLAEHLGPWMDHKRIDPAGPETLRGVQQ